MQIIKDNLMTNVDRVDDKLKVANISIDGLAKHCAKITELLIIINDIRKSDHSGSSPINYRTSTDKFAHFTSKKHKNTTRNLPLLVTENETEINIPESYPPIMYRNREFTFGQLSQLQDILIKDMSNNIALTLYNVFESAVSQLESQKQSFQNMSSMSRDIEASSNNNKMNSSVVIEIQSKKGRLTRLKKNRDHNSRSVVSSPAKEGLKFGIDSKNFNFENLPKIDRSFLKNL